MGAKAKAKAKALRENSSSRHKFISHEADVPVAVAVTACDLVDTPEYVQANPRSHIRLRSMASNWANAHRSRVTFVSAHTGVGVDTGAERLATIVLPWGLLIILRVSSPCAFTFAVFLCELLCWWHGGVVAGQHGVGCAIWCLRCVLTFTSCRYVDTKMFR